MEEEIHVLFTISDLGQIVQIPLIVDINITMDIVINNVTMHYVCLMVMIVILLPQNVPQRKYLCTS